MSAYREGCEELKQRVRAGARPPHPVDGTIVEVRGPDMNGVFSALNETRERATLTGHRLTTALNALDRATAA